MIFIAIAAGDGSLKAIRRIKKNSSRQFASIAEPIYAQGWQIANELYRRFQQDAQVNVLLLPILLNYDFLKDIQETQIEPISVIREKIHESMEYSCKKEIILHTLISHINFFSLICRSDKKGRIILCLSQNLKPKTMYF